MKTVTPLALELARAEVRVSKELLWFAQHPHLPLRHPERFLRAADVQQAIIERDRLRAMVRSRNQLQKEE